MESERKLIERIRREFGAPRGGRVVLGIGDDCAIFRPDAREDLLFTTDFLIEDVHFRRGTHRAEDAGWKALARGLSDIAAMGGVPRFCLVSLGLAPWADESWIDGFYGGLLRLADGAAGNPLYVTELVAALARSSSLTISEAGAADARTSRSHATGNAMPC